MARITVEDCSEVVPNRFKLVLLAARRAREIAAGSTLTVSRDNDKNPVIALREIAEQTVSLESIQEGLVQTFQRHFIRDEGEMDIESEMDVSGWQDDSASSSGLTDAEDDDEEDFTSEEMSEEE